MAPGGFFDRLQASIQQKIELFRLEQRYTRRRHRRSTFISNAVYVDGEYVYQTPNSTGSSSTSSDPPSARVDALHQSEPEAAAYAAAAAKEKRLSRRLSSLAMPRR
ncbi:hypothetical protein SODALDRAFT_324441 [Sodiomyces alkalinus F11]|uniref:Uncharacterized protein n=1 Tax=Sodiomyces alkalinus (strain CBS 110278 / VKM F-3762 / F11) TaxID=1314773 RepID=A0A3N2PTZ4_SODAK|nr:hypothetical protein SODALDRAFT_324441 [Sodiomyces alkalinus F11]ROT37985.1 hypothetical protein SODALDRAFT_324441 [Sodiomyces alkalinus F11]